MSPKNQAKVKRDTEAESDTGIDFDGLAAYWLEDSESLHIMGIAKTVDGDLLNEYREVQLVVLDAAGAVIGRDYTNWGDFGRKRPFSFVFAEDSLFGRPSEVQVFPTS